MNSHIREGVAIHRIKQSVSKEGIPLKLSVRIASEISSLASDDSANFIFNPGSEVVAKELELTIQNIDRIRKVTEVVEDHYGIDIGHGKFASIANFGKDLSSLAGVAIATQNLIEISTTLIHQCENSEMKVSEEVHKEFGYALALFIIECVLFKIPISFRAAWKGTRYLNNRLLWRLRGVSTMLYRVVLSEIHRFIRSLAPKVLIEFSEDFIDFIIPILVRDFQINWVFNNFSSDNILETANNMFINLLEFIEEYYQIKTPNLDDSDKVQLFIAFTKEMTEFSSEIPVPTKEEVTKFFLDED